MLSLFLRFSLSAPNWKLAWSEEFDYTGLPNPKYWNYEVGFVRNTYSLYYTYADERTARVENGNLVLEAHYDPNSTLPNGTVYQYTSGSIISKYKVDFLYGKLETRLKVPPGGGTWPAFWLKGSNFDEVGWPLCGEVDMMEFIGNSPDTLWSTFHMGGPNYPKDAEWSVGGTLTTKNASSIYHNYTFIWSNTSASMYIDNKFAVKYDRPANDDIRTWPYDVPLYLLINFAIGGSWGGQVDNKIFDSEVKYYVDYIRYYIDLNDPLHEESYKVINANIARSS